MHITWYNCNIFDNLWQKTIAVHNTPDLFELRDGKLSQNCRCFLLHFFFRPDLWMWCECLIYFYLAFFNSLSFSVFFSIFSNDNIFAIRCKWQMWKSCLCFFLALIFCAFLVKFGLHPFLYPFGLGPNSIAGEKDVQSELSGSLGRERVAEPWLCSPAIPLSSPSLGSFCSLINLFFAVSLIFFLHFSPLRAWSQARDLYIFLKNRLEVQLQGRLYL